MHREIPPPATRTLLAPLLAALPAAAVSPTPPESLLPHLSPVLRQRVQLLSATAPPDAAEPWLPLLCYDAHPTKLRRLMEIAKGHEALEAHPVSGEVEVDWEDGVVVLYRRVDEETFRARAEVKDLGLWARLVWCTGDTQGEGGPDGWRIGEIGVVPEAADSASGRHEIAGWDSIGEAEGKWREEAVRHAVRKSSEPANGFSHGTGRTGNGIGHADHEEDEDDDDYWAQYDANTPSRTPATKRSPAPDCLNGYLDGSADEDAYYAQYASVQPALDNDDPKEATQNGPRESTFNGISGQPLSNQFEWQAEFSESSQAWKDHGSLSHKNVGALPESNDDQADHMEHLEHPQPGSSPASTGSIMIRDLERKAAGQESSEMAVRQHIGSSLKSLFRLSRTVGMEMEEFERVVRTEIQMLSMMEESS